MRTKFKSSKKLQYAAVIGGGVVLLASIGFMAPRLAAMRDSVKLSGKVSGGTVHAGNEKAEGHADKHADKHAEDGEGGEGGHAKKEESALASAQNVFKNLHAKVESLRHAEEENERLRLENSFLRAKVETLHFDCRKDSASKLTADFASKLDKETGSRIGRTIAGIGYRPPGHLLPAQLYVLAISYFKAKEDEKAAVLLSFLTGLEDNDAYKNPKNFLMAGVAWYRVDNLELADQYFDKVLAARAAAKVAKKSADGDESEHEGAHGDAHGEKVAEGHDSGHGDSHEREPASAVSHADGGKLEQYQAQARLWKGLVARRLGQSRKSQSWLREVVDHHPNSEEASWVNTGVASHGSGSED